MPRNPPAVLEMNNGLSTTWFWNFYKTLEISGLGYLGSFYENESMNHLFEDFGGELESIWHGQNSEILYPAMIIFASEQVTRILE